MAANRVLFPGQADGDDDGGMGGVVSEDPDLAGVVPAGEVLYGERHVQAECLAWAGGIQPEPKGSDGGFDGLDSERALAFLQHHGLREQIQDSGIALEAGGGDSPEVDRFRIRIEIGFDEHAHRHSKLREQRVCCGKLDCLDEPAGLGLWRYRHHKVVALAGYNRDNPRAEVHPPDFAWAQRNGLVGIGRDP